jgi:ABC-type polar amino acid transport system ATPase subunit
MMANLSEPTSALDEETMKKVEKTLLSLLPSRVSLKPILEVLRIRAD